jgi:hypothetical protein
MMFAEVQLPDGAAVADDWEGGQSCGRLRSSSLVAALMMAGLMRRLL